MKTLSLSNGNGQKRIEAGKADDDQLYGIAGISRFSGRIERDGSTIFPLFEVDAAVGVPGGDGDGEVFEILFSDVGDLVTFPGSDVDGVARCYGSGFIVQKHYGPPL